jgi:hypothetical protein
MAMKSCNWCHAYFDAAHPADNYCKDEHRELDGTRLKASAARAAAAAVPFTMPVTVARSARPAPTPVRKGTLSVAEGIRELAGQTLGPADTQRMNNQREGDMLVRAAGLTPR